MTMLDPMGQAIEAAFGPVMEAALHPLIVELQAVRVEVATLTAQQADVMAEVDKLRNGKGILARFLNGG